jgi:hypothetical protein
MIHKNEKKVTLKKKIVLNEPLIDICPASKDLNPALQ